MGEEKGGGITGEGREKGGKERTMIKSWASAHPHVDAMCKIPAGCGLGGRKLRVMMGEMGAVGRKVSRRWVTGPLLF